MLLFFLQPHEEKTHFFLIIIDVFHLEFIYELSCLFQVPNVLNFAKSSILVEEHNRLHSYVKKNDVEADVA